ncbi:hypothetical protein Sxan_77390 [Streptomyces xanthophaeus]|uniref:Uncharacterized protein n=1 Tax=Streptomyces xanthophaeus TaxID=67385 RepID=A0A919H630_9ACTN|nr:hypothetical protein Sxan_77390 [Streptomyces xanthophaeus]
MNDLAGTPDTERTALGATPDLGIQPRVLMSIRVSRDSGRTWSPRSRVLEGDPFDILSNPGRYPPCECPRCGGTSSSVRALQPASIAPGSA